MAGKYLTLSDDLVQCADVLAGYLRGLGYRLGVERAEIEYPYTPTFRAGRQRTTMFVEVTSGVQRDRVEDWVRFGRSCASDTRVSLCIPETFEVNEGAQLFLRRQGVGLFRFGDSGIVEMLPPTDLAVNVQLPEPRRLPAGVRALLGPAYEKFSRGDWREGFEEASLAVEKEARSYLRNGIRGGRIVIINGHGRPATPTLIKVKRMTLGELAGAFRSIQNQTHTDALLASVLPKLNPERIGVVHHKGSAAAERKLRQNVGRLMWTAIQALRALKS